MSVGEGLYEDEKDEDEEQMKEGDGEDEDEDVKDNEDLPQKPMCALMLIRMRDWGRRR